VKEKAELDADMKAIDGPEIFINKIFANDIHFLIPNGMGEKFTLLPETKKVLINLARGEDGRFRHEL
jgi:hypothetical protein